MRLAFRSCLLAFAAFLGVWLAVSLPLGTMAAEAPANPAQLAKILSSWEATSHRLQSLEVSLTRRDVNPAWGNASVFEGRAFLEKPDRARLEFWKMVEQPNKTMSREDQEHIICTGKSVLQYVFATKQIFVYTLTKEQRDQVLNEGPIPFLFHFEANKAKERYKFSFVREAPNAYILKVIPLQRADSEAFSLAWLSLNKKSFLPLKLVMIMPNGKEQREYEFSSIKGRDHLDPKIFVGKGIEGWTVIRNPDQGLKTSQRPRTQK